MRVMKYLITIGFPYFHNSSLNWYSFEWRLVTFLTVINRSGFDSFFSDHPALDISVHVAHCPDLTDRIGLDHHGGQSGEIHDSLSQLQINAMRKYFYLSVSFCLSLSLCFYVSLCLPISVSCFSASLSFCISVSMSIFGSLSFGPSVYLFFCWRLSLCLFVLWNGFQPIWLNSFFFNVYDSMVFHYVTNLSLFIKENDH